MAPSERRWRCLRWAAGRLAVWLLVVCVVVITMHTVSADLPTATAIGLAGIYLAQRIVRWIAQSPGAAWSQ
jgi:xanthosine utilization system XapX-like protein